MIYTIYVGHYDLYHLRGQVINMAFWAGSRRFEPLHLTLTNCRLVSRQLVCFMVTSCQEYYIQESTRK